MMASPGDLVTGTLGFQDSFTLCEGDELPTDVVETAPISAKLELGSVRRKFSDKAGTATRFATT